MGARGQGRRPLRRATAVYGAVIHRFGALGPDLARGLSLRHERGPLTARRTSWAPSPGWGIADDAAFLGQPETNGCAERWIPPSKQCLWAERHDTIDELRQAVAGFVHSYNTQWPIGRLGHRTPKEAYQDATTTKAA